MYVIILSVIAGALALYYILFKDINLFKKYGIPYPKPLPLIGNVGPSILRLQSVGDVLKDMYNVHPEAKYIGVYDFVTPVIMLRDPELVNSIAHKHFDVFPDHRIFIEEDLEPLFAKNLFSLCGDKWRDIRAMLTPAFTSSKLKTMFKLMSDYAVEFTNFVAQLPPEQRVMETKGTFSRYANDMIAACAFSVNVDSLRDPQNLFYVYGKEAARSFSIDNLVKLYIARTLPWLANIFQLKFFRKEIGHFFQDLVKTTIRTRDEKGISRQDMLQLMMESRGKRGGKKELTIEDMTSQAFIFFFGGYDSMSTLMCFAAHEIAVNEDVRKRLQDEIDQVLEDTNGQAPYDAVTSMEYLDAVVNEALRMYPVAPVMDRVCAKDFELPPALPGAKPYTMKKGGLVGIPIYAFHHDPKYFEEPEKFKPDRFLGEQKKHILSSGAYLPFGLGPRMCIGYRFVLIETKVLLFHLLARCDLLPCEKTSIPLKLAKDVVMKPEDGFWLKVVPRKNLHRSVAIKNANVMHDL